MKFTIEVDSYVSFDEVGKLEFAIYLGRDVLEPIVSSFDLNEVIYNALEAFAMPVDSPYIMTDDEEAQKMYENILAALNEGIEYAERKYNNLIEAGKDK
tara:strand:+ start:134 stop:430 length:297 start_codon:yes stop_codon:yes gene_type:complete